MTWVYFLVVLEIKIWNGFMELRSRYQQSFAPSEAYGGKSVFILFPASRGCLYFLTYGLFFHLQTQWCSIFKSLSPSSIFLPSFSPLLFFSPLSFSHSFLFHWKISFSDLNFFKGTLWLLYYPPGLYRIILPSWNALISRICQVPFVMKNIIITSFEDLTGRHP